MRSVGVTGTLEDFVQAIIAKLFAAANENVQVSGSQSGWWLVVGGWWLVVGGWWLAAGADL
jgi:hypothetical protein